MICACKKYTNYQKNGILLINIQNEDNPDDIYHSFYNTNTFEPYCFCPIKLLEKDKKNLNNETNYFFVGGFNSLKGKGEIKLYKINYISKYEITIEFIYDIDLISKKPRIDDFSGAITCIIQTKNYENILISCSNGYIYLFSFSNINYFLFYEEQEKKGINYDDRNFYFKEIQSKFNEEKKKKIIKFNNKEMFDKILKKYSKGKF